jgi:amino acid adenylation domain-containing protein
MNVRTSHDMAAGIAEKNEGLCDYNRGFTGALDQQQVHNLLLKWNDTACEFPATRTIPELFAAQASRAPRAEAVILGEQRLTYAALEDRANQLAHYLQSRGVGPEAIVGICIDRSLEMIIGLLAILKAGGAYLPLDKNYPLDHISYLLKDSSVAIVLTSSDTHEMFASCGVQTLDINPDSAVIANQPKGAPKGGADAANLAYLMYTSGSSGRPKGVGVTHANISRLVLNTNYVQIAPRDVFLQLAPVTFDAATFEIWGALLNGSRLVLYPPDAMLDLQKLKRVIHENSVGVLWLTAGLFNSIVDADIDILSPVTQLLVGGDVVSAPHVRRLMERLNECRVINGYGPTEGTTFSVCFPIPDTSAIERKVPIGRPISNTTAYVLDADGQLLPVGATGELYIGGAGLSRGYFQRPDLTAESFVPHPFGGHGERLYRTGDMVRYSEDGLLEFVGRIDFQVKVRGHRIELEEIEAALLTMPGIRQAAVLARPDPRGDKRLVAYVVGAGQGGPDLKVLRENLSLRLPGYTVPSVFVVLNALPLTANGKVDRRALPSPDPNPNPAATEPGIEESVAEIWKSALGVSEVGPNDDFFDLGGTSLALINVVVEMGKRFAIPLDTSIVIRGATVSALAAAVRERINTFVPSSIERLVA